MRLFICGQKSFGADVFRGLVEDKHEIVGVAAPLNTDRTHDHFTFAAEQYGCQIIPAGTLRSYNLPKNVDLIVTAFCHDFISEKVRNRTRLGGIGYHPSLLPRHRGRDSVEWTIRMKDAITGGTVFWLTNECDGGDIINQRHCFVLPGDDARSLYRRELYPMGIELIRQTVDEFSRGIFKRTPQPRAAVTWEPSMDRPPIFKPELPQLCAPGEWGLYNG